MSAEVGKHKGPCCESCIQDQQVGMWDWADGCCCEALRAAEAGGIISPALDGDCDCWGGLS